MFQGPESKKSPFFIFSFFIFHFYFIEGKRKFSALDSSASSAGGGGGVGRKGSERNKIRRTEGQDRRKGDS